MRSGNRGGAARRGRMICQGRSALPHAGGFLLFPRPIRSYLLLSCCLMISPGIGKPAFGAGQAAPAGDSRWAILVSGISGEPELQKRYLKNLTEMRSVLESSLGFPPDHIVALFDDPAMDPSRIQHQSTRDNLAKVCREIAGRAGGEDLVFVFLEGHGDSDGRNYKFNMVGPDPAGEDLASMIYAIPAQRFVVFNGTNCSGASLGALAGKGRIVISATKSGLEKNLTRLSAYFVEAFADNNADVDKNARISILEAFQYAARKVEEYYTREGSLQTEHPVLSDNGEAAALTLADAGTRTSLLAGSVFLDRGSPLLLGDMSPEGQALAREARSLEKQVELLKSMKDEMSEEEYLKRLEGLLLKLAEVQARLRKK